MDNMKRAILYAKVSRLFCDCVLLSVEYGEDAESIGLKEFSDAAEAFQERVGVAVKEMQGVVNG
jgi:hypothetical protein